MATDDVAISGAELTFTADDYCKIYMNGEFVASGPAPSYPHHYYFLKVDIGKYLKTGKNCIAAHCYYQGLGNRGGRNISPDRLEKLANTIIFSIKKTKK